MDTILGKLFDEEEIDMRDALSDLIAGNDFTDKKGLIFVHRKLRRDANDNRIRCSCNTGPSRDGHKDCRYCDGVGYLWDERFIRAFIYNKRYMSMADSTTFLEETGRANTESFIFITKHTNMLYEGDYMIEYSKDDTGKVQFPFIVDTKFIVTASKEMGAVRNLNEYILATANVVFRHDYNRL